MPFAIVRDDITHVHADALVNAANEQLRRGGGVCGAIFAAAGERKLQRACDKIGHCDTGSAVATKAFALPARYVIHAVGPIWHGGTHGERDLLSSCYRKSLELALELRCRSIAFPLISAGIYGYPTREALEVAQQEIRAFLEQHEMEVTLVLYDPKVMQLTDDLRIRVERYIDDVYVGAQARVSQRLGWEWQELQARESGYHAGMSEDACYDAMEMAPVQAAPAAASKPGRLSLPHPELPHPLRNLLDHLDAGFSETLLAMIDDRGLTDAQVYKRANISRQHFSKMRSNPHYQPTKTTVLALAVALELTLDETTMLLERAGFALSHADCRDVIIEFFIREGNYDIFEINEVLFAYDQQLLG